MITTEQHAILRHASDTGRYLTGGTSRDFAVCKDLAAAGLLRDHGPQRLADGDHYYTTTVFGREALNEWQAAQPKPPYKKPPSEAFRRWRAYCEAFQRIPFGEFWKMLKTGEYQLP